MGAVRPADFILVLIFQICPSGALLRAVFVCFFNLLVFDLTIFAIEDRMEMTECSVNTTVFLVAQTDRQTDRQAVRLTHTKAYINKQM